MIIATLISLISAFLGRTNFVDSFINCFNWNLVSNGDAAPVLCWAEVIIIALIVIVKIIDRATR